MLKPYFVEMSITAVVMAESETLALIKAEHSSHEICRDGKLRADTAVQVQSLAELAQMDGDWTGECLPYGGDGETCLQALIPESAPHRDTKTIDMFSAPAAQTPFQ